MKRYSYILIVCAFLLIALSCGQRKSSDNQKTVDNQVAVYVTGDCEANIKKIVGSKLVESIMKSDEYIAVERTDAILEMLSKEEDYQHSGKVDDKQIGKLGKKLGVKYVCIAEIVTYSGLNYISSRLVDVETGQPIKFKDVYGDIKSMSKLVKMSSEIAAKLFEIDSDTNDDNDGIKTENEYVILKDYDLMVMKEDIRNNINYAAAEKVCKELQIGGFTDWRLPTRDELQIIYSQKEFIGGFQDGRYWTSTKYDNIYGEEINCKFFISFENGHINGSSVDNFNNCRCVRSTIKRDTVNSTPSPTTEQYNFTKILDYLYVYPEDIKGQFTYEDITQLVQTINENKNYGYSDWRIPNMKELRLLKGEDILERQNYFSNEKKSEYGDECYNGFDGYGYESGFIRKGTVRLVRTDKNIK